MICLLRDFNFCVGTVMLINYQITNKLRSIQLALIDI